MKKVLIFLAPGFEEVEALTPIDILRRAGAHVTIVGTIDGPIEGRSQIKVLADITLDQLPDSSYDMIILPGGMPGTENLKKDPRVRAIVEKQFKEGKWISAICAAPSILSAWDLTPGKKVTSHPSVTNQLTRELYSEERVVVDGHILTSRAPGTAMEFAFKLVESLYGKEKANTVNQGVLAALPSS